MTLPKGYGAKKKVTDDTQKEEKGVDEDISADNLLQADATIIVGVLIFLTLSSLSSSPIKLLSGVLAPLAGTLQYIVSAILIFPFAYSASHLLRPKKDINLVEARAIMKSGFVILIITLAVLAVIIGISNASK
jgi:hypothetical protein